MKKASFELTFKLVIAFFSSLILFSCEKCKDCKECELNPTTGQYDKNCSAYKEYCGNDLKQVEQFDIFICK